MVLSFISFLRGVLGGVATLVQGSNQCQTGYEGTPDPPPAKPRCGGVSSPGDVEPRRGRVCGCQCDDSELGEVLINPQPVPVFQVWRAGVTLVKFGDVRKQVCSEEVQGPRRKNG